jgi:hypothetical protein
MRGVPNGLFSQPERRGGTNRSLVLTGVSLSLVANASAAPRQGARGADQAWMDRASNPETNGF